MKVNNESKTPRIGDVFMVECTGTKSEQSGVRPAVIFQNNVGNQHSPNVIVLPLTSKRKKTRQPTHVLVSAAESGLPLDSMVLCENPICISKDKLGQYMTTLSPKHMEQIAIASILASSAICYISPELLERVWQTAAKLNAA